MKHPAALALAQRLKALRGARGWTQEQLAERTGLDRSYIAGIETATRNPTLKVLARLADSFQTPLHALFEEGKTP